MSRPRIYRTEAIVLRRRNIGEADTVFTILSEREGKLDVIARGVRKLRSKARGHLEPIMRTELLLAQGRTFDVVTQAQTVHAYRAVREDLALCAQALYCLELTDRLTGERSPAPGLYACLASVLETLESGAGTHIVRWFELQLLAHTGYEVQADQCAICRGRLAEEETLFSASAGGLVCVGCRPRAGPGRLLSVRAIKVLRYARGASPFDFARLHVPAALDEELRGALSAMVHRVLERRPGTERHIDEIAALDRRLAAAQSAGGVEFGKTDSGFADAGSGAGDASPRV